MRMYPVRLYLTCTNLTRLTTSEIQVFQWGIYTQDSRMSANVIDAIDFEIKRQLWISRKYNSPDCQTSEEITTLALGAYLIFSIPATVVICFLSSQSTE